MLDTGEIPVFPGLDAGKGGRHVRGLTTAGQDRPVHDNQLPHSEPRLRVVIDEHAATFGRVLVILVRPSSIGTLPREGLGQVPM